MTIDRSHETRASASRNNESLTFRHGEIAAGEDFNRAAPCELNALFANSVNSLAASMVNFSCCVRGFANVTREVTARSEPSAIRMEAGVHAGV